MNKLLEKDVYEMLLKYFGRSTAEIYLYSHKDKSDDFIILSLTELLTKYLGEEKAMEELNKLKNDL